MLTATFAVDPAFARAGEKPETQGSKVPTASATWTAGSSVQSGPPRGIQADNSGL